MRASGLAWMAAVTLTWAGTAWSQTAHQHGYGTATITFEGNRVAVELVLPGPDVVGFERPPQTPAEETALAAAVQALRNPVGIIDLPPAARCSVTTAEVAAEGYKPPAAVAVATGHTEFEVAYMFTCGDAGNICVIGFPFFAKFLRSEELEVTVLTERGPTQYEVTRNKPQLDRGNFLWRWLTGR
jgi:hypothetical protein